MKQTQGTKVFGLAIVQAGSVSDETVEVELKNVFEYLDTNFGLMNQFADRRFDKFFSAVYPEIGFVPNRKQDEEMVEPAVDTTIKSKKVSGGLLDDQRETIEYIDYRQPPALIHLIWHDILLFVNSILEGYMDKLSDTEIRQTKILDSLVEYCKSILYCDDGKKSRGLSVQELETPLYRQLRYNITSIYKELKEA
jgi:hypothetical protein